MFSSWSWGMNQWWSGSGGRDGELTQGLTASDQFYVRCVDIFTGIRNSSLVIFVSLNLFEMTTTEGHRRTLVLRTASMLPMPSLWKFLTWLFVGWSDGLPLVSGISTTKASLGSHLFLFLFPPLWPTGGTRGNLFGGLCVHKLPKPPATCPRALQSSPLWLVPFNLLFECSIFSNISKMPFSSPWSRSLINPPIEAHRRLAGPRPWVLGRRTLAPFRNFRLETTPTERGSQEIWWKQSRFAWNLRIFWPWNMKSSQNLVKAQIAMQRSHHFWPNLRPIGLFIHKLEGGEHPNRYMQFDVFFKRCEGFNQVAVVADVWRV